MGSARVETEDTVLLAESCKAVCTAVSKVNYHCCPGDKNGDGVDRPMPATMPETSANRFDTTSTVNQIVRNNATLVHPSERVTSSGSSPHLQGMVEAPPGEANRDGLRKQDFAICRP